jgi:hypothetical protein
MKSSLPQPQIKINSSHLSSFLSGSCVPLLPGRMARGVRSGDVWILRWGGVNLPCDLAYEVLVLTFHGGLFTRISVPPSG